MAIPAKRFDSLTKDFNVASATFASIKDSGILNAPEEILADIASEAKGLVDQLKGLGEKFTEDSGLGELASEAKDMLSTVSGLSNDAMSTIKDATRFAQNVANTFTDLSKLPESIIGDLVDSLIPSELSGLSNALKNMTKTCRNNVLGSSLPFGRMSGIGCNGLNFGTDNCQKASAGVLGKGLASGLNSALGAVNNMIGKILALGNLGFNAGLCGVLGSLLDGVTDKGILGTTLGVLANQQGLKGNLNAIFDISKNAAGVGVTVSNLFPKTAETILSGTKSLGLNFQNASLQALEGLESSLDVLQPDWKLDGSNPIGLKLPSVERLAEASTKVKDSMIQSLRLNNFSESNLNAIPDVDETYVTLDGLLA